MTEAMPFLQKYDITFLRPPTIWPGAFCFLSEPREREKSDFVAEKLWTLRVLCDKINQDREVLIASAER